MIFKNKLFLLHLYLTSIQDFKCVKKTIFFLQLLFIKKLWLN